MNLEQIKEENTRHERYGEILLELPYDKMKEPLTVNDGKMKKLLTIIITSSPIPSHPSTEIIEQCISSIRAYDELKKCNIIITLDGIPSCNLDLFKDSYAKYKENLILLISNNPNFKNVVLLSSDEYIHQLNTIRNAVKVVDTPYVFVIEHDWVFFGEIKFRDIVSLLGSYTGIIKCIRFSYVSHFIHNDILYASFVRPDKISFNGVNLIYTDKWSCHPHIASVDAYSYWFSMISEKSRCYMEEFLYGTEYTRMQINHSNFYDFGTWVYAEPNSSPDGMKHIVHIDGRKSESVRKLPSVFVYKRRIPAGAPCPEGSYVDHS